MKAAESLVTQSFRGNAQLMNFRTVFSLMKILQVIPASLWRPVVTWCSLIASHNLNVIGNFDSC